MSIEKTMPRVANWNLWRLVGLVLAVAVLDISSCNMAPQDSPASNPFAKVNSDNAAYKNADTMEAMARTDHIALLEKCLAHCRSQYKDYTCDFMKQERIAGQLSKEQDIEAKFRQSPFSVSLFWTRNSPSGDRLLYVEGEWDNQVLVRPAGLLSIIGTVKRPTAGPETFRAALHPVTDFGFERGLISLLSVYSQAKKAGDLKQEFGGYAEVAGRKTIVLVRYLPPGDQYPSHKNLTYIDLEYQVPTLIEGYDGQGQLSYRYMYTDIHFNKGLTAHDFLPEANDMKNPG